jgi:hypothetical protein
MIKRNYFTPSTSYCCIQNRFTMFTSTPLQQHGGIHDPHAVSSKILPQISHQSVATDRSAGREMAKTRVSKPRENLEAIKYDSFKDSSQITRKRAVISQFQNRASTRPDKDVSPNSTRQALRRVRSGGSAVPKKVQNRPAAPIIDPMRIVES